MTHRQFYEPFAPNEREKMRRKVSNVMETNLSHIVKTYFHFLRCAFLVCLNKRAMHMKWLWVARWKPSLLLKRLAACFLFGLCRSAESKPRRCICETDYAIAMGTMIMMMKMMMVVVVVVMMMTTTTMMMMMMMTTMVGVMIMMMMMI